MPVQRGVPGFYEFSQNAHPRARNLRVEGGGTPQTPAMITGARRSLRSAARSRVGRRWTPAPAAGTTGVSSGKRNWNGLDPFHQPAATTDYYGSGDIDLDGRITQADVASVQQMAAALPACQPGRHQRRREGRLPGRPIASKPLSVGRSCPPGGTSSLHEMRAWRG